MWTQLAREHIDVSIVGGCLERWQASRFNCKDAARYAPCVHQYEALRADFFGCRGLTLRECHDGRQVVRQHTAKDSSGECEGEIQFSIHWGELSAPIIALAVSLGSSVAVDRTEALLLAVAQIVPRDQTLVFNERVVTSAI